MFGEVFNNEIKLKEDECCIVFDFGCYFPYEDADHLFFDFEFDGQIFNDKVINHRYPNKSYQTITKEIRQEIKVRLDIHTFSNWIIRGLKCCM